MDGGGGRALSVFTRFSRLDARGGLYGNGAEVAAEQDRPTRHE